MSNGVATRRFGQSAQPAPLNESAFQVNFQTVTLEMTAATTGASYPVLNPAAAGAALTASRKIFSQDVILLGCYLSATFLTAAAVEQAAIGIGRDGLDTIRVLGDNGLYLQLAYFSLSAGGPASQSIQRNAGSFFTPPFMPKIPVGSGVQIYGSIQTSLNWRTLATIYYLTLPQYHQAVQALGYGG